jgi:hypothetical protein
VHVVILPRLVLSPSVQVIRDAVLDRHLICKNLENLNQKPAKANMHRHLICIAHN